MTAHCETKSRMSTILKSFWQVQLPSLLERLSNLVIISCVQTKPYGVFFKASSKISTNLGPSSLIPPYTEGRTSLNREGGKAHPEGFQKAGCELSVAEGSFIKRWQTSRWGCRAIRRIIVQKWLWLWQSRFKWCYQSANEVVALFSPW